MFKKILIPAILLCFSLNAASLDPASAKLEFTAFKTPQKVAVVGVLEDGKYKFKKKSGTIKELLSGATASFDLAKINIGSNKLKNENVAKFFTALLKDKTIKVTFKNVTQGQGLGIILARIKLNGINRNIPLQYIQKNSQLVITGLLDLSDYKAGPALKSLEDNVKEHLGLSWSQVELKFSIILKQ